MRPPPPATRPPPPPTRPPPRTGSAAGVMASVRPSPIPIGTAWTEPASQNGVAANRDAARIFGPSFILILLVVGWRVAFSVVGWRVAFSRHGQKRGNAAYMDHARSAASASVQPPSFQSARTTILADR